MPSPTQDYDTRALNEGFTEGGDLTLRSRDNVNFSVHSLFLSVASPVFSHMITVNGTRQDVVQVQEAAETLALMLKFIYPMPPPTISSFHQLGEALGVAEKYKLDAMKMCLRKQMMTSNEPVSISADPLRAWAIACAHRLPEETDAAMSLASKRFSFPQACLSHLTENFPCHHHWIKLLGVPSAKLHILTDVLFSFHREPMQLNSENCQWALCDFCAIMYFNSRLRNGPEWQARWAHAVFAQLKGLPVHEWGPIFGIGFFNAALKHNGGVPIRLPEPYGTCTCPDSINRSPTEFERWTSSVHEHLKERVIPVLLGEFQCGNWLLDRTFTVSDV